MKSNLKTNFYYYMLYTLLFGIFSFIGFSPFFNEKALIWKVDAAGQYFPAFLYIGSWLREILHNIFTGNFSIPLFDMSIGMGEDIIGCLNYYGLGDPLNIIAVFSTKTNGAFLFTFMFFLRLYLAGLTFYKYCLYIKLNRFLSLTGIFAYIFSGYALCGGMRYIEFLSPMIYLPLLLLGYEKILKSEKSYMFTLSVAYAAMCNFYFLYMTTLFLGFYCIIRGIIFFGKKNIITMLSKLIQCLIKYILGLGFAAPILVPSVSSFFNSARTDLNPLSIICNLNNWIPDTDLFYNFFKGIICRKDVNYWSSVPILEIAALLLIFFLKKNRRNLQCMIAVCLGIIIYCMPITNYIASGFGNNYVRWVFILQFIFCIVMIIFLEELTQIFHLWNTRTVRSGLVLSVLVNILFNVCYLNSPKGLNWSDEFITYKISNTCVDSPINYSSIDTSATYRIANSPLTAIYNQPENIAMLNNYNGLTFWFSIVNQFTQNLVNQLGNTQQNYWRSYGLNHSSIYESLACVKYYVAKENFPIPLGFGKTETISFNDCDWNVYENKYCLPLGYTYDDTFSTDEYEKLNYMQKMYILLDRIVLENIPTGNMPTPLSAVQPHAIISGSSLSLYYDILPTQEAYLYITKNASTNNIKNLTVEEIDNENYIKLLNQQDVFFGLGSHFKNNRLTINIEYKEDLSETIEELTNNIFIYTINEKYLQQAITNRGKESLEKIAFINNCISGELSVSSDKYLLLAIPYHSGWQAYIDGEEVPIYKANTMYMSIYVPEGQHDIIFRYAPRCLEIGCIIFLVTLITIVLSCFCKRNSLTKYVS